MAAVLARAWLLLDILSMKVFLRALRRDDEFSDAHLFYFDRYSALAELHRQAGRVPQAAALAAVADEHYRAFYGDAGPDDDDDSPEAAAIALPVPARRMVTHAVASRHLSRQTRRERRRGRTTVADRY